MHNITLDIQMTIDQSPKDLLNTNLVEVQKFLQRVTKEVLSTMLLEYLKEVEQKREDLKPQIALKTTVQFAVQNHTEIIQMDDLAVTVKNLAVE